MAALSAATLFGLPTRSGRVIPGKRTVLRTANTGSESFEKLEWLEWFMGLSIIRNDGAVSRFVKRT